MLSSLCPCTDDGMRSPVSPVSLPRFHDLLEQLEKYRRPSFGSPSSPHSSTPLSADRDTSKERERDAIKDRDGDRTARRPPPPQYHRLPSSSRSSRATGSASFADPNARMDIELDSRSVGRDSRNGDGPVLMREDEERDGERNRDMESETKVGSWLEAVVAHDLLTLSVSNTVTSPHFSRGRTSEPKDPSGSRGSRSCTPTPSANGHANTSYGGRTRGHTFGCEYSYEEDSDTNLRRRHSSLREDDKDNLAEPSSSRREDKRSPSITAAPTSSSDHRNVQRDSQTNSHNQVTHRRTLQNVLLGVGGFGFAWSEDSMRKLRYCLSWLQYATAHIDAQILVLRDFTASLQQHYPASPATPTNSSRTSRSHSRHERRASENMTISTDHQNRLIDIRRDVVRTVRDVVKVISTYGGGATLPESAKNAVKGFILRLPHNWSARADSTAAAAGVPHGPGSGRESLTTAAAGGHAGRGHHPHTRTKDRGVGGSSTTSPHSSRAASPNASRVLLRDSNPEDVAGAGQTMSASTAVVAAQRILVLATESLDMMRGVTGVVKESLDSADAWVERLRQVGLQRAEAAGRSDGPPGDFFPPVGPGDEYRGENMRDPRDSDLLSPLNISRRGSVSSSAGSVYDYASPGRSSAVSPAPSSSSYTSYSVAGYHPNGAPMDAPSPDMGRVMRSMTLVDEDDVEIKREDDDERAGRMDVDS
ncbi:hypothetical protein D9758_005029 [Tetrapyrgos nigripes]|uniref:Opi1-domain-containing protein n=1 Tax=Tetrapyrgos nigripes TaxID=182062 RepID=A0A8H5GW88_9AGAR|nr:hypothetical protein D9758_005029 [Tetrapyrgos nigripes]